jgi:hypothetical protein
MSLVESQSCAGVHGIKVDSVCECLSRLLAYKTNHAHTNIHSLVYVYVLAIKTTYLSLLSCGTVDNCFII